MADVEMMIYILKQHNKIQNFYVLQTDRQTVWNVCMYVYVYVCTCVCMYVCLCVYYESMYVCIMNVYIMYVLHMFECIYTGCFTTLGHNCRK